MEKEESSQSSTLRNDDNDNNTEADQPSETLPYVTTSEVLRQLNQNLQDLAPPGEEAYCKPRFELQKRLPDGSTIPASQADLSASDLQNKISQSAKFVSQLILSDRKIWAEQQRQSGNSLFQQGQYKAAMDIYLTCLVVKGSTTTTTAAASGQEETPDFEFLSQTLLPVLNNLAQCTLQLGMQKKTKDFCGIALEEIAKVDDANNFDPIAICKIHFKRAKAHRLTGHYSEARQDLNVSLSFVEKKEKALAEDTEEDDVDDSITSITSPFRQAIQKEFRHLEAAEKEARKNRQRQKKSMQRALASSKSAASNSESSGKSPAKTSGISVPKEPRKYSALRARKKVSVTDSSSAEDAQEGRMDVRDLSYWQYYWLVVARVAETLLILIGDDDEDEERTQQRQVQPTRREDRKTR
mmetsp:Transcript_42165/g.101769  ORF Transcript_42165/g.101769 Transcript_42165/m.101769 type:complete len:411 (-) Transcript_42165:3642-4874(-)